MRHFFLIWVLALAFMGLAGASGNDEKDDCDDCVIVLVPQKASPPHQAPMSLARTLWGLFLVARPRSKATGAACLPPAPEKT
jgi:hypothetical protein